MQIKFSKLLSEIDRDTKVVECLCPRKNECSGKIIKAHSIQNNRILKKIAYKGVVNQIKGENLIFKQDGSEVGRKIATTFSGFCNYHDNELFKPIELKNYDPNNKEQEFFFAYRALAMELNLKKIAENRYKKMAEVFGQNQFFTNILHGTKLTINELTERNDLFHEAILNKNFELISTKTIELDKEYLIAVSSIFAIEYDFKGNIINDFSELVKNNNNKMKIIFLTIFPQENKTFVLLSYLKENASTFEFLDEQLLKIDKTTIIKRLNLLIANYCENVVYSPKNWQKINKNEKQELIKTFSKELNFNELKKPQDLVESPRFNLFF